MLAGGSRWGAPHGQGGQGLRAHDLSNIHFFWGKGTSSQRAKAGDSLRLWGASAGFGEIFDQEAPHFLYPTPSQMRNVIYSEGQSGEGGCSSQKGTPTLLPTAK